MNKKTFMIQAILAACCIITSCSSDTVDGNKEYFTRGQITYVQEDENKIFFFDNQDGTAMVTYNRKYPPFTEYIPISIVKNQIYKIYKL